MYYLLVIKRKTSDVTTRLQAHIIGQLGISLKKKRTLDHFYDSGGCEGTISQNTIGKVELKLHQENHFNDLTRVVEIGDDRRAGNIRR